MRLIAKNDVFNSKVLGVKLDERDKLFKHANVIHKGARFNIGTAEFYKDLSSTEQEYVGTLIKYGIVCIDNKENVENGVIPTIDAEVAAERGQELRAKNAAFAEKK